MDYAKREAWAYANYVHDVALLGLPLDDKQLTTAKAPSSTSWPRKPRRSGSTATAVATQVEEVDRVKKRWTPILDKAKDDPAKQTVEYARILTPFARHNTEREWRLERPRLSGHPG